MTEEQKARFKELARRFGHPSNPLNQAEVHEFAWLTFLVPINIKTGAIPLLDEVEAEQRSDEHAQIG